MAVRRTILVVEDEKDIRELVRFHLEQEGYAVREADSGERALQQIASERPALVVLDISLPRMNGLELSTLIARERPGIKVLIMSGKLSGELLLVGKSMDFQSLEQKSVMSKCVTCEDARKIVES